MLAAARASRKKRPRADSSARYFSLITQSHRASQVKIERFVGDAHRAATQFDRFAILRRQQLVMLKARRSAVRRSFERVPRRRLSAVRTEPNYSAHDLAQIRVPVVLVKSEHDEFIRREHAEYLARSIPNAELLNLRGVSHFAPLQRPGQFNSAMLAFLAKLDLETR
jgi:pimeloyl-ACP methyl ester carboxylesterase